MKKYLDKHNKEIQNGDIIEIPQTVNGENQFIIADVKAGDVRYFRNPDIRYEYDVHELLSYQSPFSDETDIEIIGTYNKELPTISQKTSKKFTFELVTESEFSEIDQDLYDELLGSDIIYNIWDNDVHPSDYVDSSKTENCPIQIDKMINHLQTIKEKGTTYIEIDYLCDHIGYLIRGYKVIKK